MQRVRAAIASAVGAIVINMAAATAADAQVCAQRKISASGANASFAILARQSARTAWISKVARDSRLGPVYSQWLRAKDRRLVCRKVDSRSVCVAAALPCRSVGSAAVVPAPGATASPKQRPL